MMNFSFTFQFYYDLFNTKVKGSNKRIKRVPKNIVEFLRFSGRFSVLVYG
jgi:hypothetical protein